MKTYIINSSIPKYHAVNLGAVLVASEFLNLDLHTICSNLENYKPIAGRGEEIEIRYNDKVITLIDDSYNANPASIKAALDNLASKKAKRKIAVISDMLELGESEVRMHQEIGEYINNLEIDLVLCMGKLSQNIFDALDHSKKGKYFTNKEALQTEIMTWLQDGDLVMLKGSKSTLMYKVADWMKTVNIVI